MLLMVLVNNMEVLVLTTTQATGQHKYQIKFTTDTLKSNGTKIYMDAYIPLYSNDYRINF